MREKLLVRGRLPGRERPVDIVVQNGVVASVSESGRGDADIGGESSNIAPPLFDIQVNGAAGINLQDPELSPDAVRALSETLAGQGVGYWVPTIITGPIESMLRCCQAVAAARKDPIVARAVPGLHLEGPFISPADGPRGAHPKAYVRPPELGIFNRLLKASDGAVVYTTVAPEAKGAIPFIRAVARRGVVVALGHHNASAESIGKAVEAGARLATHLGNGAAPMMPRHDNPIWPQLAEDRLATSVIPDLHHLPPPVLKTFIRAKGWRNTILTSDCAHLAGMKPGRYSVWGTAVELTREGRINLCGTGLLAGSALQLLQGVVNGEQVTDLSMAQALKCATAIPARVLGLKLRFPVPRVGRRAEFIIFDVDTNSRRWRARLRAVFLNGQRRK